MQAQKQTFLCAECSRDTPAEKLRLGPEYVFCTASCAKRFQKRGYAEARRQALLAAWHFAARMSFRDVHRMISQGVRAGRTAMVHRLTKYGGQVDRFIDTLSSPDAPEHWADAAGRMLNQKE